MYVVLHNMVCRDIHMRLSQWNSYLPAAGAVDMKGYWGLPQVRRAAPSYPSPNSRIRLNEPSVKNIFMYLCFDRWRLMND